LALTLKKKTFSESNFKLHHFTVVMIHCSSQSIQICT